MIKCIVNTSTRTRYSIVTGFHLNKYIGTKKFMFAASMNIFYLFSRLRKKGREDVDKNIGEIYWKGNREASMNLTVFEVCQEPKIYKWQNMNLMLQVYLFLFWFWPLFFLLGNYVLIRLDARCYDYCFILSVEILSDTKLYHLGKLSHHWEKSSISYFSQERIINKSIKIVS